MPYQDTETDERYEEPPLDLQEIIILEDNEDEEVESDNQTCRICLREGKLPIFVGNAPEQLCKSICEIGGIEVSADDPYPKFLCQSCDELLKGAITFRKTAQLSDKRLRMEKAEENIEPISDDEINPSEHTDHSDLSDCDDADDTAKKTSVDDHTYHRGSPDFDDTSKKMSLGEHIDRNKHSDDSGHSDESKHSDDIEHSDDSELTDHSDLSDCDDADDTTKKTSVDEHTYHRGPPDFDDTSKKMSLGEHIDRNIHSDDSEHSGATEHSDDSKHSDDSEHTDHSDLSDCDDADDTTKKTSVDEHTYHRGPSDFDDTSKKMSFGEHNEHSDDSEHPDDSKHSDAGEHSYDYDHSDSRDPDYTLEKTNLSEQTYETNDRTDEQKQYSNDLKQTAKRVIRRHCKRCDLTLNSSEEYIIHIKTPEHENKRIECKICKKTLSYHYYRKHPCVCNPLYKTAKQLKGRHCKRCDLTLNSSEEYRIHIKTPEHENKKIECKICKKTLSHKYYRNHPCVRNPLYKTAKRGRHCKRCDITLNSTKEYRIHITSTEHENKRIECKICRKTLSHHYYRKHPCVRNPLYKPPVTHICDICGKKSTSKTQHSRHQVVHSDDRPYACPYCPYRGKSPQVLKLHIRTHTGEKPYQCTICLSRFINKGGFNLHMLTHKGMRDIHCEICGKGFHFKRDLDLHIKVDHDGIKDYVCQTCGKAFGYRRNLMNHEQRGHKTTTQKIAVAGRK